MNGLQSLFLPVIAILLLLLILGWRLYAIAVRVDRLHRQVLGARAAAGAVRGGARGSSAPVFPMGHRAPLLSRRTALWVGRPMPTLPRLRPEPEPLPVPG